MILTCPQCDTRFVVPSTIFVKGGRQVKCSNCQHKWFQDNPDKAVSDFKMDDIVRESPQKTDRPKQSSMMENIKGDFSNGIGVILMTAAIVCLGFIVYQMMRPALVIGQWLAFDMVKIERVEGNLRVTGNIVNAMNDDRSVPSIHIVQILEDGVEGDSILVAPEKDILASGEMIGFETMIDSVGDSVENLRITFHGQEE